MLSHGVYEASLQLLDFLGYRDWPAFLHALNAFLFSYWHVLQITLIVVAIVILISSTEDLLLDLLYWLGAIFGPIFGHRQPRTRKVTAKPERMTAVIIPAWNESAIIGRVLQSMVDRLDYRNYHVFVGVYPNDPLTRQEVDAAAARFANVHRVDVSRPGPTSKADCLNHLVEGALRHERASGIRYEMFVNHDAEDLVHPFELKVMNWFLDSASMIQLPVLSFNRPSEKLVACHYMDEFAEWHGKDLVVRSALTGMTPSAGVGTALSRAAMDALRRESNNQPFNPESFTEDYDIAHRLKKLGHRSRFVRYWAEMPTERKAWFGEGTVRTRRPQLVATREYFPVALRASYRQKARWMLGIAYSGWRQLGWYGGLMNRWFLWRDRKVLIAAPAVILAYLLVVQWLAYAGALWFIPGLAQLPPLIEKQWVWTIISINLWLMLNRLLHRAIFVNRAHGLRYILLSPVRAVVGNFINFFAFARATRQNLVQALTGFHVPWEKTAHEFPTFAELETAGSRLFGTPRTVRGIPHPARMRKTSRARKFVIRRRAGSYWLDEDGKKKPVNPPGQRQE